MKRSEVNNLIRDSIDFFEKMNFKLPPWAFWSPEDWKGKYDICEEIVDNKLGWDVTDFGSGNFFERGLILFTIRNRNPEKDRKTFTEKVMIVEENQETPMHFHWQKMEDIINRGGGNLIIELYKSDQKGSLSNESFQVKIDSIRRTIHSGAKLVLKPGESICLGQGIYHRFYGEEGQGKTLVGVVSTVNNDNSDNRFNGDIGRFPDIVEDENLIHLLFSDYYKYM